MLRLPPEVPFYQTNKYFCVFPPPDAGKVGSAINYPSLYAPVDSPIYINPPSTPECQIHMAYFLQPRPFYAPSRECGPFWELPSDNPLLLSPFYYPFMWSWSRASEMLLFLQLTGTKTLQVYPTPYLTVTSIPCASKILCLSLPAN